MARCIRSRSLHPWAFPFLSFSFPFLFHPGARAACAACKGDLVPAAARRHVVVVDERNFVCGIITRRDLAHAAGSWLGRWVLAARLPRRRERECLCMVSCQPSSHASNASSSRVPQGKERRAACGGGFGSAAWPAGRRSAPQCMGQHQRGCLRRLLAPMCPCTIAPSNTLPCLHEKCESARDERATAGQAHLRGQMLRMWRYCSAAIASMASSMSTLAVATTGQGLRRRGALRTRRRILVSGWFRGPGTNL